MGTEYYGLNHDTKQAFNFGKGFSHEALERAITPGLTRDAIIVILTEDVRDGFWSPDMLATANDWIPKVVDDMLKAGSPLHLMPDQPATDDYGSYILVGSRYVNEDNIGKPIGYSERMQT